MEIYGLMDQLASKGKAIIMISSELPEVIGMSDRIYIMSDGIIMGVCNRDEYNSEQIGVKMMGLGGAKDV
ncbi:MAG: sugar transporter ATP-binding protein [Lachnospiraceae bacterium]|nr:sugar transporter ATP-binding protein [Lachnospiraceae bacterium]